MNVRNLKTDVQRSMLAEICMIIALNQGSYDNFTIEYILDKLVNSLDYLSEDDTFGTEGWKKHFNVEDV